MNAKEKKPTQLNNIDNDMQPKANDAETAQLTENDISVLQPQPNELEKSKHGGNEENDDKSKKQTANNDKNKKDNTLIVSEAKPKLLNDKVDAKPKTKLGVRDYIYLAIAVVLMGILVICVVFFAIGFRPAVVLTPSMKPNINPGSLVLVKSIDPEKIEVGDVIMFWPSSGTTETDKISITHRVIKITVNESGLRTFTTHGDANGEGSNETVTQSQVIGKVHFVIPVIGALFLFIKNNLFVVLFGVIALICLWYMISISIKNKKAKQVATSTNSNKTTNINKNLSVHTNNATNTIEQENNHTKNINANQKQKNIASKKSNNKDNKRR